MTISKQDPGIYPSDYVAPANIEGIQKIFDTYNFFNGRMISGSKSYYYKEHPEDLIVFNANIIMENFGKVFYGDLNLTEDYLALKEISEALDSTLFVLRESDGRFGKENDAFDTLKRKSVWNTNITEKPNAQWYKEYKCY